MLMLSIKKKYDRSSNGGPAHHKMGNVKERKAQDRTRAIN